MEKSTDRAIYTTFLLGLYFEATGQAGKSLECFERTDRLTRRGHNFGDLSRLRIAEAKKTAANP